MEGEGRFRRRRRRILIGVAASLLVAAVLGLSLSYLFLVVRDQPLYGGQGLSSAYPAHHEEGPRIDSEAYVADYVPGATITVVTSLTNDGRFPVTVTAVHTDPDYLAIRLAAARSAAMDGPQACCAIDEQATWAATGFHPLHLGRGDMGVLMLHFVLGHQCSSPGGGSEIDDITVDYDEMGWHHTDRVQLTTPLVVRYGDTGQCPRAAAPTAAPQAPSTPG